MAFLQYQSQLLIGLLIEPLIHTVELQIEFVEVLPHRGDVFGLLVVLAALLLGLVALGLGVSALGVALFDGLRVGLHNVYNF